MAAGDALKTYLFYYPAFWTGYVWFRMTGRTPKMVYRALRRLYSSSRGSFNYTASRWLIPRVEREAVEPGSGLLGSGPELATALDRALADLHRDGFHVFENRMPAPQVAALVDLARNSEATLSPRGPGAPARARFDPDNPQAARYILDQQTVVDSEAAQRFMLDPTVILLAERYLDALPINQVVSILWTAPADAASHSGAAMKYHWDLDGLRFIKFFVYLTDVEPDNGPHVVVRGSHRNRPHKFYRDRRFSDDEVVSVFPDDVVELTGLAGTVIAVDTKALHKGKPPEIGHRLMLQLEYTNSLFGSPHVRIEVRTDRSGPLATAVAEHPTVFQRFTV